MEKFPKHKMLTLFTRKSGKNHYDQALIPLLKELNEIPSDYFETKWSKKTTIEI